MSYGQDGRLVSMQLEELIGGLEKEELLIIKDYIAPRRKIVPDKVVDGLLKLSYEELMRPQTIAKLLGYEYFDNYEEVGVFTKGYRILNKIPRMPSNIVENLVKSFKSFQHILEADIEQVKEEIKRCEGTQFDPQIAEVFLDILNNDYDKIKDIQEKYLSE